MIYVCLEGQYNYALGKELGYTYDSDFLSGFTWGTDATWQGNNEGNKSIAKVLDTLYNYNYTEVHLVGYNISNKVSCLMATV